MDLKQFRYYIEAAEPLSFTRPARRLRISQTALSQQICAIERIVGTDLFIPGQFGSALTTLRIHGNNWSSGPGD